MTEPAARWLVVAHGPTQAASDLVLADRRPLLTPPGPAPVAEPAWSRVTGPEPACLETVAAWGGADTVLPELAGPDVGCWAGRRIADVAAADPAGLQAWLADVDARPHGGETLAELVARVAAVLDAAAAGSSVVTVTPLVARALTVAALGAPASVLPALDVGHGGRVLLSRNGPRWRLLELLRRPPAG